MQNFGRVTLADICDDLVIYRQLEPLDKRLPKVKTAQRRVGLTGNPIPRKQEADYAKIALWYAGEAQRVREVSTPLQELLFIGDTIYNDGQAYENMRTVSGWRGSCFIGTDVIDEAPKEQTDEESGLYMANRWSALGKWAEWLSQQGMSLNEETVVIVDIDKTALGAKGRNDGVIDQARLEGAYETMSALLTQKFDGPAFEHYYRELNRERYHAVTADNQDYIAYICLVLSTGLIGFDDLIGEINAGQLSSFDQFIRLVETRMMIRPVNSEFFRQAHDAVIMAVRNDDPTPFKRFRRQEFISTVKRMGQLADDTDADVLLLEEITINNELYELVTWLRKRGCLIICLSDKPDEASCPHPHVSPDLPPVHRAETHAVGTSIQPTLDALGT